MVRVFSPQGRNSNITTNTNYPPQGLIFGGGAGPVTEVAMLYEDSDTMLYEDGTVMIYEDGT